MNSSPVATSISGQVARLQFNRANSHNILDNQFIISLKSTFESLNNRNDIRIIVVEGTGKSFSAGADLKWMEAAAALSSEDNLSESLQLSSCFRSIDSSPHITIARVHGNSFGGANGFVAACDLAYASLEARFSLPEVKLGLVPATIAPYLIRKIGYSRCLELMLTGRVFSGTEAESAGLVNRACPESELDQVIGLTISQLLAAAPVAQTQIKRQLRSLAFPVVDDILVRQTAELIASIRVTREAREGIGAFLGKRPPEWTDGGTESHIK